MLHLSVVVSLMCVALRSVAWTVKKSPQLNVNLVSTDLVVLTTRDMNHVVALYPVISCVSDYKRLPGQLLCPVEYK